MMMVNENGGRNYTAELEEPSLSQERFLSSISFCRIQEHVGTIGSLNINKGDDGKDWTR